MGCPTSGKGMGSAIAGTSKGHAGSVKDSVWCTGFWCVVVVLAPPPPAAGLLVHLDRHGSVAREGYRG